MQGTTTELLLVPVLITLSAFFSATETAYFPQPRPPQKPGRPRAKARSRHPGPGGPV